MDKTEFEYQHLRKGQAPGGDEYYTVTWSGYTGGQIPAGLIVARLAKLGQDDEPSTLWTVFHHSGFVVNYDVALHTRRQAVSFAAELGKLAKQAGFTWNMDREELINKTVADKQYQVLRHEQIPAAIRKAMAS